MSKASEAKAGTTTAARSVYWFKAGDDTQDQGGAAVVGNDNVFELQEKVKIMVQNTAGIPAAAVDRVVVSLQRSASSASSELSSVSVYWRCEWSSCAATWAGFNNDLAGPRRDGLTVAHTLVVVAGPVKRWRLTAVCLRKVGMPISGYPPLCCKGTPFYMPGWVMITKTTKQRCSGKPYAAPRLYADARPTIDVLIGAATVTMYVDSRSLLPSPPSSTHSSPTCPNLLWICSGFALDFHTNPYTGVTRLSCKKKRGKRID